MSIQIKDLHPCDACGGFLTGKDGRCSVFEVVRFSQAVINARSINRTMGLAQFFGGGNMGMVLADVMGTSEPAADIVAEQEGASWTEIMLCQNCWIERFADLVEKANAREESETVKP